MQRECVVKLIEESGIIAVIRLNEDNRIDLIIDALCKGGVKALEITMTTPNAVQIIEKVSVGIGDEFLIGVGTVTTGKEAKTAIEAGAQFVVSPVLNLDVIKVAKNHDVAVFPGAFTPTEILTAWQNGADIVKVFPATALGPKFFKDIHGPLPQIKLTPTGGVSLENAAEFIRMGAACLGVGTALLNKQLIKEGNWSGLQKLAQSFVMEVKRAREEMGIEAPELF